MENDRRDQGFWNQLWRQFAQSFVGSMATVLLGFIVAFVTGFVNMKSEVSALTKDVAALKLQIEERDKTAIAAKLHAAEADGKMQGQINSIENKYNFLILQSQQLKDTVERKKADR